MNRTRTMSIAALAAASLALIGCESSPGPDTREALIGTWAAEHPADANEQTTRLRFGTAEGHWHGAWITVGAGGVDVVHFRYDVHPRAKEPGRYNLDMSAFDHGPLKSQWMYGLLEWVDEESQSFRLDADVGPTSDPKLRPKEFSADTKVYRRVVE